MTPRRTRGAAALSAEKKRQNVETAESKVTKVTKITKATTSLKKGVKAAKKSSNDEEREQVIPKASSKAVAAATTPGKKKASSASTASSKKTPESTAATPTKKVAQAATPKKKTAQATSPKKGEMNSVKKLQQQPNKKRSRNVAEQNGSKSSGGSTVNRHSGPAKKSKSANTSAGSAANLASGETSIVHRCRFVKWVPDAVYAMAASGDGSELAIARRGGAVEVWRVGSNGGWHQAILIPGQAGEDEDSLAANTVLSLTWVDYLGGSFGGADKDSSVNAKGFSRLFCGDLEGGLFEADLRSEERINSTSSMGGPAWCMDAHSDKGWVAVGCEDGRVRIFEATNDGRLEYLRMFRSSTNGRILALKWANFNSGLALFTGGVDGFIRKWDGISGAVTMQISTESYGKSNTVAVRALCALKDGTLFSGDSEGHVHVWDTTEATGGVLLKGFHEHLADVTALAASEDGRSVFASGVDSRVAMFQLSQLPSKDSDSSFGLSGASVGEWIYTYSHRPHSHDVRGLCVANRGTTLVSAGDDTQLVYYPIQGFARARPVKVSPFLHRPLVHLNIGASLMLVQHTFHLELFRPKLDSQKPLLEMRFNDRLGIRCSALSPQGHMLACSDDQGLRVFKLDAPQKGEDARALKIKRLIFEDRKDALANGAVVVAMCFSDSGDMIACALQNGQIVILQALLNQSKPGIQRRATLNQLASVRKQVIAAQNKKSDDSRENNTDGNGVNKKKLKPENSNALSSDSDSSSESGSDSDSDSDSSSDSGSDADMKAQKPSAPNGVAAKKINGARTKIQILSPNQAGGAVQRIMWSGNGEWLAVGDASGTIMVFSVDTLQLQCEISRATLGGQVFTAMAFQPLSDRGVLAIATADNKVWLYDVEGNCLEPWSKVHSETVLAKNQTERIVGISFSVDQPYTAILWGRGFFTKIEFKNDATPGQRMEHHKVHTAYKPIVYLERLSSKELVVVEAPWIKVMESFPNVLQRRRFGGAN